MKTFLIELSVREETAATYQVRAKDKAEVEQLLKDKCVEDIGELVDETCIDYAEAIMGIRESTSRLSPAKRKSHVTFDVALKAIMAGEGAIRSGLSAPLRLKDGVIYEGDSRLWVPYPSQIVADDWELVPLD